MGVPGVKYFGPGRRRGLPDKRRAPRKERRHPDMGKTAPAKDNNGGAKVTLSLQVIIHTLVMASLLGAAGYAVTKLQEIPSPGTIERIDSRLLDVEKARESSSLRMLAMEKDVARLALDTQDIKNTMKEIERLMRRQAEGRAVR